MRPIPAVNTDALSQRFAPAAGRQLAWFVRQHAGRRLTISYAFATMAKFTFRASASSPQSNAGVVAGHARKRRAGWKGAAKRDGAIASRGRADPREVTEIRAGPLRSQPLQRGAEACKLRAGSQVRRPS